jgi:hypothetical protein
MVEDDWAWTVTCDGLVHKAMSWVLGNAVMMTSEELKLLLCMEY